jgi:hypothetical protein
VSFDLGASGSLGGVITTEALDTEDRWYHLVAQYDADDESYSIYVDGAFQKSGISTENIAAQTANTLTFGTRTGSTEYFGGALREMRIYNRELQNYEIAALAGVLAHWEFEESSGSVAYDSSVAANDANFINSPTLAVDGPFVAKSGNAVELNGTNESINAGASLLDNLSEFTIAGWVRPEQVAAQTSFFGQSGVAEVGIKDGVNRLLFSTSAGNEIYADGQLPIGKWSFVTAVGEGSGLRLYVNGVEVASGGSAASDYGTSVFDFKIGEGVFESSGDYFDGRLDEVRVYSRAMCPDEVRSLYKGSRPDGVRIIRWSETR